MAYLSWIVIFFTRNWGIDAKANSSRSVSGEELERVNFGCEISCKHFTGTTFYTVACIKNLKHEKKIH